MPEIKRTFQAGKMNRTLDDRLIKQGEYREALNVNIGRSDSSDVGAVENILGNVKVNNPNAIDGGICIGAYRDNGNERIYFFVTNNDNDNELNEGDHGVFEYNQATSSINLLASGSWLNFHVTKLITGINFVDDLLFWTDDRNEPRKINVNRARNDGDFYDSNDVAAVAKVAPYTAPRVTRVDAENDSNFMQDKFIRFAYRYKFNDGEYSTISLFTPIVFDSIDGVTAADIATAAAQGEIGAFVNSIRRVFLAVDVPVNAGITAVELLYNESTTTNIYILEEVSVNTISSSDDDINLEFTYESQDPFRAIPGSQLTRVYDAVPRLAQAQEFAGGRIVYGNYLQNYNLPSMSFLVTATGKSTDGNAIYARQSVKSRRTYQVGVVLADKYGRQSPVILSSTGGDTVFVEGEAGDFDSGVAQRLQIKFNTSFPDWAYSYRVVVKQREQEYHNWFYQRESSPNVRSAIVAGNNINKVPRDTTGETIVTGSIAIAPTTVEVYRKLDGVNITDTDTRKVISLTYGANSDNNVIANMPFDITNGSGVFEVAPVTSELDIFYETSTGGKTSDVGDDEIPVDFFNCYILDVDAVAHLELNRLRAGFNTTWFTIGLKAYAVQENFSEQRRFNTLIHSSGLFNSRVGINQSNQFNEAEGGITVSLDPADGSVQKLFAEDTQMIIFQEDKISRSPIDKDFIYSAEGGSIPVTSSTQYLGTIAPYAGEYGISQNPESFAVYGTRKYFSDKNRGVVLRLSNDGLTEISENGMTDFFRDALASSTQVIGSFDEHHDNYNITIVGSDSYSGYEDTNVATASDGYFTVSFEEEVRGWPSFKSFKQESATTLNNRYYSLNGGDLWEHNVGTVYNSFYDTAHESYLECIMNDNPSDVKEFKTVNYEGKEGWVCDTVQTEQDNLRLDPDARSLSEVYEMRLVLDEEVSDGNILGSQTQYLTVGSQIQWVIKVEPASPSYIFSSSDDVTLTFEGDSITGVLNEDTNSLYFTFGPDYLVQTFVDGENQTGDQTFDITIQGAANEDISGAILTITFIDNFGGVDFDAVDTENDFSIEIDQNSDFRAGQAILAYSADSVDPDVPIRIEMNSRIFQFGDLNDLFFTPSDSIDPLFIDPANFTITSVVEDDGAYARWLAEWTGDINLPVSTTSGTISVQNATDNDFIRQRPRIRFLSPSNGDTNASNNFAYQTGEYENADKREVRFFRLAFGELTELTEANDFQVLFPLPAFDGDVVTSPEFYLVPEYDGANNEGWYIPAAPTPIYGLGNGVASATIRPIDRGVVPDGIDGLDLVGSIGITLISDPLVKSIDRDTPSVVETLGGVLSQFDIYRIGDPQLDQGGLGVLQWRPASTDEIVADVDTNITFVSRSDQTGFRYRVTHNGAAEDPFTDIKLVVNGTDVAPYTNPLNPLAGDLINPGSNIEMNFDDLESTPTGVRFHITPVIVNDALYRGPLTDIFGDEYFKVVDFV